MFEGMRYVYEVYKEMSFSKAAGNLFISQPSLSAAVKKTENRIGFPIFDRSTTPIQLTQLGREYIRSTERILDIEKSFERYVNDLQDLKTGTISIGGTNMFASFILPPLLSAFTERYPLIEVNLVEDSTTELEDRLFAGNLDLVIDNTVMDESVYEKIFFCEEHLLLTVPKKYESNDAAGNYALTFEDIESGRHLDHDFPAVNLNLFKNDPFLFLKSGNDTRTRADRICHNNKFVPRIKLKLEQQITAYHLSSYGMGISFTGDLLIKHTKGNDALVYYKLDHSAAARAVNFYYKRNRYLSRAVSEFLRLVNRPADC